MLASARPFSDVTPPPPEKSSLPGAHLALALLLAINLFNYIDRQVLAAVEPQISAEIFPLGDQNANAKMGLLATAFLISYMVLAPILGWLADRYSRWVLMGVGVLLWSLASGGSGLAGTFFILLLTRCFVGVGEAAYGPAAPTVLADYYPLRVRGRILSWFYLAIPVGSALGYILGGKVAAAFGWRWAFYLVVPPGILLGLWCFFQKEPPRGQAESSGESNNGVRAGLKDYLVLLRTPSYVLNTLGMAAATFAVGGMGFWMPRYIAIYRGVQDLAMVNMIFGAILVLAGLGATLLGGLAGDRLRSRWSGAYFLVSGVSMLISFPLCLLVLVTPFPWAWGLIFLAVFGLFFNTGPTNTILANVTHPAIRATAFAVNIFFVHALGDAISPPVIGAVADVSNLDVGFLVVSGMILVSALFWLWGSLYLGRDMALAPLRSNRDNYLETTDFLGIRQDKDLLKIGEFDL